MFTIFRGLKDDEAKHDEDKRVALRKQLRKLPSRVVLAVYNGTNMLA